LLRTAKSCGPDAPTLASSLRRHIGPTGRGLAISADDGGKRARSPGRARNKPLKPLRAGMPGDSRWTCGDDPCALPTSHAGLWVQRAPGIPHALNGRKIHAKLGRFVPRDLYACLEIVIASAAKQSILSLRDEMDCFAEPVIGRRFAPTRWLAMTVPGRAFAPTHRLAMTALQLNCRGCLKIEAGVGGALFALPMARQWATQIHSSCRT
jgi:hypothetical protein